MRENFTRILQAWDQDHVSLLSDQGERLGMHERLTMPEQAAAPSTAANEVAFYSQNGQASDVYYRVESDGASGQIISDRFVALNGLKLEAYCVFNTDNGGFLSAPTLEKSEDGGTVIGEREIKSFNVSSVTPNLAQDPSGFTVNFSPEISTADYFAVIDTFRLKNVIGGVNGFMQIKNNATYSDSCTTAKLELENRDLQGGGSLISANLNFSLVSVQIWTPSQ